jgi:hypothetical protein
MSYTLKTDEILEALCDISHPLASGFRSQVEGLTQLMADALAGQLNIKAGRATFEGVGFAGTACTFAPLSAGQTIPEPMAGYDSADEWELLA